MSSFLVIVIIIIAIIGSAMKNQGRQNTQGGRNVQNQNRQSGQYTRPAQNSAYQAGQSSTYQEERRAAQNNAYQTAGQRTPQYSAYRTGQRPAQGNTYQMGQRTGQHTDILQKAMNNVKNATSHNPHQYHNPADDKENCEKVGTVFDDVRPTSQKVKTDKEERAELSRAYKSDAADISWLSGTALMDEVQNLITCGYDGDLEFSRDFVSEGIEMLNNMASQQS